MEGSYVLGDREALWTNWYLNGMMKEEANYSKGKLNGQSYAGMRMETDQKKVLMNQVSKMECGFGITILELKKNN